MTGSRPDVGVKDDEPNEAAQLALLLAGDANLAYRFKEHDGGERAAVPHVELCGAEGAGDDDGKGETIGGGNVEAHGTGPFVHRRPLACGVAEKAVTQRKGAPAARGRRTGMRRQHTSNEARREAGCRRW